MKDVGKPKAEVAAAFINSRIAGVNVTPHFCRIEDKPTEFYQEFQIIILGLDSIEARKYMNSIVCSLLGKWAQLSVLDACLVCAIELAAGSTNSKSMAIWP